MFWMYLFKLRKVVRLSDPRHFDHILPFLRPEDIPHRIDLSSDDICKMHEEDGDKVQRMPLRKSTRFRVTASGEPVLVTPDSVASDADSGENLGELDTGESDAVEQEKGSPSDVQHKVLLGPKDYKRLKHGKDTPFDAELQYLKPQLLSQALVHHKFVMDLSEGIWIDEKTGKTAPCSFMAVKAYSRPQAKFWYVDFTIISLLERSSPHVPQRDPRKELLQRCVHHGPRTSHGHTHALVSLLYYPHTSQLRSTRYVLLHAVRHLPSPSSPRARALLKYRPYNFLLEDPAKPNLFSS